MRLLFVPLGWPTHYYPTVGMAWACQLRGHEVLVAAEPGMTEPVARSGIPVTPLGKGFDFIGDTEQNRRMWATARRQDPQAQGELRAAISAGPVERYHQLARATAPELIAFCRAWRPDVVVTDPMVFAGPLAGRVVGARVVRHLWGVDAARNQGMPGSGADADGRALGWPAGLISLYAEYGQEVADDLADATIDPCPPSLQFPGGRGRLPVRYTPYNGGGVAAPPMGERDRPLVCVTWGTAAARLGGSESVGILRVLEAAGEVDADFVLAVRAQDAENLGPLPANVAVVRSMPLSVLLPQCDAIVHQGGAGTMMTAAHFGVPQLVLASIADQRINAARLAAQGAGISLPLEDADARSIASGVRDLVKSPGLADAARELRAEMRQMPEPAAVVSQLEDLR